MLSPTIFIWFLGNEFRLVCIQIDFWLAYLWQFNIESDKAHEATSHNFIQCWPMSTAPFGVSRPQNYLIHYDQFGFIVNIDLQTAIIQREREIIYFI